MGENLAIIVDREQIGADARTMESGTAFAQVGHAVMLAAEARKTVEATAARMILQHLPADIQERSLATALTRMFTYGLWLTGSTEAILAGAAARRTAPSIRPIISKLIAKAQKEHDAEAVRRLRQGLNIAPGLGMPALSIAGTSAVWEQLHEISSRQHCRRQEPESQAAKKVVKTRDWSHRAESTFALATSSCGRLALLYGSF